MKIHRGWLYRSQGGTVVTVLAFAQNLATRQNQIVFQDTLGGPIWVASEFVFSTHYKEHYWGPGSPPEA